ncbi:MAG: hypothetical protein IIT48_01915 [Lachnospiraceae bacterium]|nr:hypothetical protein [Lachnospiraceae bacterium]
MDIDVDKLREDLKQECYGAFFGAGIGGALIESFDIENASDEEIIDKAKSKGIDIEDYR